MSLIPSDHRQSISFTEYRRLLCRFALCRFHLSFGLVRSGTARSTANGPEPSQW